MNKLDAINTILTSVFMETIGDLQSISQGSNAEMAEMRLESIKNQFLAENDWWFQPTVIKEIQVSIIDQCYPIPPNVISVLIKDSDISVSVNDGKLWNTQTNSFYSDGDTLTLIIESIQEFENLQFYAQDVIVIRACRSFAGRVLGNSDARELLLTLDKEERASMNALKRMNMKNKGSKLNLNL